MAQVLAENFIGEAAVGLLARRRERDELVRRITEILQADSRVAAAWLFGSAARGEGDDMGDLDIRVTVADEHTPAVCRGG